MFEHLPGMVNQIPRRVEYIRVYLYVYSRNIGSPWSIEWCRVIDANDCIAILLILQAFEEVSVLFCELSDFKSSSLEGAMQVVDNMNTVFTCFDSLMDQFNVYKASFYFY